MKREEISNGIGNISTRHIQEAAEYFNNENKIRCLRKRNRKIKWGRCCRYAYSVPSSHTIFDCIPTNFHPILMPESVQSAPFPLR